MGQSSKVWGKVAGGEGRGQSIEYGRGGQGAGAGAVNGRLPVLAQADSVQLWPLCHRLGESQS